MTGLVLEVNDSMIAIQKGKDRWEIARNSNTKVTGDLKVGAKVTITYTLTATGMEVKSVFNPDAFIASHGQPVSTVFFRYWTGLDHTGPTRPRRGEKHSLALRH